MVPKGEEVATASGRFLPGDEAGGINRSVDERVIPHPCFPYRILLYRMRSSFWAIFFCLATIFVFFQFSDKSIA